MTVASAAAARSAAAVVTVALLPATPDPLGRLWLCGRGGRGGLPAGVEVKFMWKVDAAEKAAEEWE